MMKRLRDIVPLDEDARFLEKVHDRNVNHQLLKNIADKDTFGTARFVIAPNGSKKAASGANFTHYQMEPNKDKRGVLGYVFKDMNSKTPRYTYSAYDDDNTPIYHHPFLKHLEDNGIEAR